MNPLRSVAVLVVTLAAATSSVVCAQQTPAAAPTVAPAASTEAAPAKPSCTKPGDYPGNLASDTQRRVWQKEYLAYQECMKKFITEQKALAEPYVKAYNAAVDDYNASIKVYNEQIEKSRK